MNCYSGGYQIMKTQVPIKMHPSAFAAFGPDLVTNDVVALMELIKNSYDAYAYHVSIEFGHQNGESYISISDDGIGMTRDIIENVWAVVATPYKKKNPTISRNGLIRKVSGNKGMGRFSSARLGRKLDIYTKNDNDVCLHVSIDWDELLNVDSSSECSIAIEELIDSTVFQSPGTKMVISALTREWNNDDFSELTENLRRLMSPFEEVSDFSIILSIQENNEQEPYVVEITPPSFVSHPVYSINAEINNEGNVAWNYVYSNPKVDKHIDDAGIIMWKHIFDNQVQYNGSNRKIPLIHRDKANCGPFSMEIRAWDLDTDSVNDISETFSISKREIRNTLRAYKGISVYRDGVLVLPKSEASRDWIGLDARRISGVGKRMSTSQMLGIVRIGSIDNPDIRDTTDREKLVDTDENAEFCTIIKAVITQLENLRDRDRERKRKEPSIVDIFSSITPAKLIEDTQDAIAKGKSAHDVLKIVQEYEADTKTKIEEARNRLFYYGQVATAGSMSSFILHEIRGGLTSIKRFLRNIYKRKDLFDTKLEEYYEIAEKSHERMLLVAESFAPLYSTTFKNKKYTTNLLQEINMSISYLADKIEKSNVAIDLSVDTNIDVEMQSGEIQTIVTNLIDNAIYWVEQANGTDRKITVNAYLHSEYENRIVISISDTGVGVPKEYAERIFEPGVTAKAHGIGMGLVIVAEILDRHQGKIALQYPGELTGATFVFDLPKA